MAPSRLAGWGHRRGVPACLPTAGAQQMPVARLCRCPQVECVVFGCVSRSPRGGGQCRSAGPAGASRVGPGAGLCVRRVCKVWLVCRSSGFGETRASRPSACGGAPPRRGRACAAACARLRCRAVVTWLILPVVICLSQRLSHACLSINASVL